jgi:2-polyprenyl-3-methyl-5-hydroxy-6-metoxy-1,4-benzoquinol methylase
LHAPEAEFVLSFSPTSVLDAGCGTGRVAIALAWHGIDVTGVDINPEMLAEAEAAAPQLDWRLADLATVQLGHLFDVILMAGNVLNYLARGTEEAVINNMASHLKPDGRLITGFQISMDRSYITLEGYDRLTTAASLTLTERYAGWDRLPWRWDSPFVVSVHRPGKDAPPG